MRINRIILRNYIGIYVGMGLYELEVDFNKDLNGNTIKKKNNIITLVGSNGSGKSTLLSALHPFSGTQDARSKIIIDGEEGYKELEISHEKNSYIIQHYYKKAIKSFIQKNGKELNENGNVTSFKEIIKNELDIDESYFKIGLIGSNVANFVDFSTGDRKKYINKFLPNIDEWLAMYTITKDKWTTIKKDVKYLSEQIQKLDNIDNISISIQSFQNKIENENKTLLSFEKDLAINNNSIKEKTKDYNLEDGNPYKETYITAKNSYSNSVNKLNRYTEKYPELEEYDINKCNSVIGSSSTNLEVSKSKLIGINNNLDEKRNLLETKKKSKNNKKIQLDKLLEKGTFEDLQEMFDDKEIELNENKTNIEKYSKFKDIKVEYKEVLSIRTTLVNLVKNLKRIKDINGSIITNVLKFNNNNNFNIEYLTDYKKKLVVNKSTNTDKLEKCKNHLNIYQNNLETKSKITLRPKECKIDSCPFIRAALKYQNVENDIIEKEEEISSLKTKIKNNENSIDTITEMIQLCESLENLYESINDNNILEIAEQCKLECNTAISSFKNFVNLLELTKNEIGDLFNVIELETFLELKESQEILQSQLENIKTNLDIVKSQINFIDEAKKDLESLIDEISTIETDISTIETDFDSITTKISKFKQKIEILEDLKKLLDIRDSSEVIMNENQENYFNTESMLEEIANIEELNKGILNKIKFKKNDIANLQIELDGWKLKESKYHEYQERKANLEENFENIEFVKNALDPMKGIPIFFTKNYLEETTRITNELLDVAYKGKFRIKFQLDDKNFFIQVLTNTGDIKNDITEASQGEIALSTISLSLSMIEQSMTRYNIILLDEIDATLDAANRINFIDMIEMQIEKLGMEQVFIISHNNQFDTYPVDLIALKDSNLELDNDTFMSGKNLLFNIYK